MTEVTNGNIPRIETVSPPTPEPPRNSKVISEADVNFGSDISSEGSAEDGGLSFLTDQLPKYVIFLGYDFLYPLQSFPNIR